MDERVAVGISEGSGLVDCESAGAGDGHTLRTAGARTAAPNERDHDTVAYGHVVNAVAHLGNGPRCFVAVDRRQASTPRAIDEVDVGMTDRTGLHIDLHLARPGGGNRDLFNREGRPKFATDCSFDHAGFNHARNLDPGNAAQRQRLRRGRPVHGDTCAEFFVHLSSSRPPR